MQESEKLLVNLKVPKFRIFFCFLAISVPFLFEKHKKKKRIFLRINSVSFLLPVKSNNKNNKVSKSIILTLTDKEGGGMKLSSNRSPAKCLLAADKTAFFPQTVASSLILSHTAHEPSKFKEHNLINPHQILKIKAKISKLDSQRKNNNKHTRVISQVKSNSLDCTKP